MSQWHGVLSSLLVLITKPGVQRSRAFLRAVSAMTFVVQVIDILIVDALEVATIFSIQCSEKLHLQSYLEMLWSETGYFGLLGNNIIFFIILLYIIER